uniref:Putative DNA ligase n=1 Tax=Rhodococcus sp. NS1 TaxID=402236 RepID=Q06G91_9NOCA|nr:hypothetical protein [Rhodococcus sp. NS1]ABI79420.1 putative DNA ligase [Rhodococcus sp. NS1]
MSAENFSLTSEDLLTSEEEQEPAASVWAEELARWRPLPPVTVVAGPRWWGTGEPVSREQLMNAWMRLPGVRPSGIRELDTRNIIFNFAAAVARSEWGRERYASAWEVVASRKSKAENTAEQAEEFGQVLAEIASPLGRYAVSFHNSLDAIKLLLRGSGVGDIARSAIWTACRDVGTVLIEGGGQRETVLSDYESARRVVDLALGLSQSFDQDPNHLLSETETELTLWCLQWAVRHYVARMDDYLWRMLPERKADGARGVTQSRIDEGIEILTRWMEEYGTRFGAGGGFLLEHTDWAKKRLGYLIHTDMKMMLTFYGYSDRKLTEPDLDVEPDLDLEAALGGDQAQLKKLERWLEKHRYGDEDRVQAAKFAVDHVVPRAALRRACGYAIEDTDLRLMFFASCAREQWRSKSVKERGEKDLEQIADQSSTASPDPSEENAQIRAVLDTVLAWVEDNYDMCVCHYGAFEVATAVDVLKADYDTVVSAASNDESFVEGLKARYAEGQPRDAISRTAKDAADMVSNLIRQAFDEAGFGQGGTNR